VSHDPGQEHAQGESGGESPHEPLGQAWNAVRHQVFRGPSAGVTQHGLEERRIEVSRERVDQSINLHLVDHLSRESAQPAAGGTLHERVCVGLAYLLPQGGGSLDDGVWADTAS
jgi:hypothetical protein